MYDDSFRKDIILVFIFAQIILNTVYFMLFAVINFILVTLEVGISAIIQLSVSPLNAIKGKIPKNILYIFGILAYIGVSIEIVFCGIYVDEPVKTISGNARLSQMWSGVSEFQIKC
ncbi:hypothetical protein Z965_00810 [Clostridium novyi A str. BKT29909]|uniref:hypothetical protein n=1 Tax=Clostridium TaxID=1485 RepID=UPI0004D5F42B|nr:MULTISPECIES: hypothetical protein [Clostridium]KEH90429.1 hypothetical protein Z965_00810 [Clostridium novyi A str. BKT29909]KEH93659.1 hypothetical protein Z963_01320 [Clostridium botulinum C/D str. It1]